MKSDWSSCVAVATEKQVRGTETGTRATKFVIFYLSISLIGLFKFLIHSVRHLFRF